MSQNLSSVALNVTSTPGSASPSTGRADLRLDGSPRLILRLGLVGRTGVR